MLYIKYIIFTKFRLLVYHLYDFFCKIIWITFWTFVSLTFSASLLAFSAFLIIMILLQVCYLNCVRILLKHGANPNCSSRSNLTPLHVLIFSASETMTLGRDLERNMEFIRSLLVLLLQHGLETNIHFSSRTAHILTALLDMVRATRDPSDMQHIYNLTLTFLQVILFFL